jgi:GMP synthase PP-ATPase subunit
VSRERGREEGLLERRGMIQVITIDTDRYIDRFLKQLSSPRRVLETEEDARRTAYLKQQIAVNLAVKILRTWSGTGNIVMAIYSEEAMKLDFKRKILGILQTAYEICEAMIDELKRKLKALEQVEDREERAKLISEINMIIDELSLLPVALILALDAIMGALQANLPVDMMPNTIKSHMGHVTT